MLKMFSRVKWVCYHQALKLCLPWKSFFSNSATTFSTKVCRCWHEQAKRLLGEIFCAKRTIRLSCVATMIRRLLGWNFYTTEHWTKCQAWQWQHDTTAVEKIQILQLQEKFDPPSPTIPTHTFELSKVWNCTALDSVSNLFSILKVSVSCFFSRHIVPLYDTNQ